MSRKNKHIKSERNKNYLFFPEPDALLKHCLLLAIEQTRLYKENGFNQSSSSLSKAKERTSISRNWPGIREAVEEGNGDVHVLIRAACVYQLSWGQTSAYVFVLHKRLTYPGSAPLFQSGAIFRAVSKGHLLYWLEKHWNKVLTENMQPLGNGCSFVRVTCCMRYINRNDALLWWQWVCSAVLTQCLA